MSFSTILSALVSLFFLDHSHFAFSLACLSCPFNGWLGYNRERALIYCFNENLHALLFLAKWSQALLNVCQTGSSSALMRFSLSVQNPPVSRSPKTFRSAHCVKCTALFFSWESLIEHLLTSSSVPLIQYHRFRITVSVPLIQYYSLPSYGRTSSVTRTEWDFCFVKSTATMRGLSERISDEKWLSSSVRSNQVRTFGCIRQTDCSEVRVVRSVDSTWSSRKTTLDGFPPSRPRSGHEGASLERDSLSLDSDFPFRFNSSLEALQTRNYTHHLMFSTVSLYYFLRENIFPLNFFS